MKKDLKKYLLGIVIGIIISSGSIVIAYALNSKDITYTPANTDWQATTVEDALNDLYNYSREDTINKLSFNVTSNSYQGARSTDSSTSLTLEAGNYIIINSLAYTTPSVTPNTDAVSTAYGQLIYPNGTCNKIHSKSVTSSATAVRSGTTYYDRIATHNGIWKCSFTEKTTISASATTMATSTAHAAGQIILYSIKLN